MTTQEFADTHGLSLEEAEMILARRNPPPIPSPLDRAAKAAQVLAAAQKRVGVHPVSVKGESLAKGYDPDADVGAVKFYRKMGWADETKPVDDWEEPP